MLINIEQLGNGTYDLRTEFEAIEVIGVQQ